MSTKVNGEGPADNLDVSAFFPPASELKPFVGLRPFESSEALIFFGRDEQTTELMQQLNRTRFLAVSGSSGCGKSSLIRAGLIPKLKAGFMLNDRGRWRFATMKPGKSPIMNLAASLLTAFGEEASGERLSRLFDEIEAAGVEAVTDYMARGLAEDAANVFLLVDQFEEIFRFGSFTEDEQVEDADERARRRAEAADFVSIMLELTRTEAVPVYVVMTMRSDFIGDCDAFHGLPQAMNRSQYLVPRLTRAQRLDAIQCPVRLCGKAISPELAVRVLDDMGEDPDQLPVMQHAMMRTWENFQKSGDKTVGVEHYEAVGTIKEALSRDADTALEDMTPRELLITERMFQALVESDAKGRRLRRPARLKEIEGITSASPEEIRAVIARFSEEVSKTLKREDVSAAVKRFGNHGRSFLVLSDDREGGDPLIDISHESLIRQWGKLKAWVDAEVEWKELYLRLAGDAVRFYSPKRNASLWIEQALQQALDWWEERQPNAPWAARYHKELALAEKFLNASRKSRDDEAARAESDRIARERAEREEQERARRDAEDKRIQAEELAEERRRKLEAVEALSMQQQQAAKRQRGLIRILVVISLIALLSAGVSAYAMWKAQDSERNAKDKEREANTAQAKSDQLAAGLQNSLDNELKTKGELEQSKKDALDQKKKAVEQATAAEAARRDAEAAKHRADESAATAEREKAAAVKASKDAEAATATANENAAKAETAKQEALEFKRVDALNREGDIAFDDYDVPLARTKYTDAAAAYHNLAVFDGEARAYDKLGALLTRSAGPSSSPITPLSEQQKGDEMKRAQSLIDTVSRDWEKVKGWVLGYEAPSDPALYANIVPDPTQREGLSDDGKAVRLYSMQNSHSSSAKVYNRVGEAIYDYRVFGSERNTSDMARAQVALGFMCEALSDYSKDGNVEGQLTLLRKLGETLRMWEVPPSDPSRDIQSRDRSSAAASGLGNPGDAGGPPTVLRPTFYGCDGKPTRAAAFYEQMLPFYREQLDGKSGQDALRYLGQIHEQTLRAGEYRLMDGDKEGARAVFDETLKFLRERDKQETDHTGYYSARWYLTTMLTDIGQTYAKVGMAAEAREKTYETIDLLDSPTEKALALKQAGDSSEGQAREDYYMRAVKIFEDAGMVREKGEALGYIGEKLSSLDYNNKPDFPKALDYLQQALSVFERLQDRKEQAYTLLRFGWVYENQQKFDEAMGYYQKVMQYALADKDYEYEGYAYSNIGTIYYKKKEFQKALDNYDKAIEAHKHANRPDDVKLIERWRENVKADMTRPAQTPTPTPTPR